MTRIPDAIAVASPDTHCLIVAVPHRGPADVSSSLPRPVAAAVLRQIADQLDEPRGQCGYTQATGKPCPVHDAPASPSMALLDAATDAPAAFARGMEQAQRPAALDRLLAGIADQLADEVEEPEQPAEEPPTLAEAFAAFGAKLRAAVESTAAGIAAFGDQLAAQTEDEPDDPRPVIEIDLDKPADPEPVEEPAPTVPTVVDCAHGYGLMRDSCPGCDAEQERPHDADPVTLRPSYAKRNMRRCRRCALVPSNPIHRPQAGQ